MLYPRSIRFGGCEFFKIKGRYRITLSFLIKLGIGTLLGYILFGSLGGYFLKGLPTDNDSNIIKICIFSGYVIEVLPILLSNIYDIFTCIIYILVSPTRTQIITSLITLLPPLYAHYKFFDLLYNVDINNLNNIFYTIFVGYIANIESMIEVYLYRFLITDNKILYKALANLSIIITILLLLTELVVEALADQLIIEQISTTFDLKAIYLYLVSGMVGIIQAVLFHSLHSLSTILVDVDFGKGLKIAFIPPSLHVSFISDFVGIFYSYGFLLVVVPLQCIVLCSKGIYVGDTTNQTVVNIIKSSYGVLTSVFMGFVLSITVLILGNVSQFQYFDIVVTLSIMLIVKIIDILIKYGRSLQIRKLISTLFTIFELLRILDCLILVEEYINNDGTIKDSDRQKLQDKIDYLKLKIIIICNQLELKALDDSNRCIKMSTEFNKCGLVSYSGDLRGFPIATGGPIKFNTNLKAKETLNGFFQDDTIITSSQV